MGRGKRGHVGVPLDSGFSRQDHPPPPQCSRHNGPLGPVFAGWPGLPHTAHDRRTAAPPWRHRGCSGKAPLEAATRGGPGVPNGHTSGPRGHDHVARGGNGERPSLSTRGTCDAQGRHCCPWPPAYGRPRSSSCALRQPLRSTPFTPLAPPKQPRPPIHATNRGVRKKPTFFFRRTALEDSPQGPPTATRHQPPTTNRQPPTANRRRLPPTANRHQPFFNRVSVVLCLGHVLTMKQRASP